MINNEGKEHSLKELQNKYRNQELMLWEKLDSKQIEINVLKAKLEGLESRIQFLEKNWVGWVQDTKLTGQKLIIALTEKMKDE